MPAHLHAPLRHAHFFRTRPIHLDDLTRLPLRSTFLDAAALSIETARASGSAVSLLVMDVDMFKLVNDTFGHLQGDAVLVEVADILRRNLRGYDLAARYAGDEFVALLPNTTSEAAEEVAQRICAAVRGHSFTLRDRVGSVPVTVSIGVSTFPQHGGTNDELFSGADRALYRVKRQGRDAVAIATGSADEPGNLPLSIDRFVGRVEELRSLVRLLEDASESTPRIVAITGEAGVGKTTLLRQLEPEVRLRSGSLVVGRCQEADVQPPYAPWAEVINAIRRLDTSPPVKWRELHHLVPALAGETDTGTPGSKYMLLDEIAEYIRLAAQSRPLVIVLDDMQWADSASWDTLEYLVPQLEREKLLLCLTIRAEELHGETLDRRRRLSRSEMFHEVKLSRLTRDEMRIWIEAAFHRQDVGRELLAFLYRHTEGNPLFVVQVLRTLLDEGAIWYTGERWEWRPVSELRLPVGVLDLIERRLSRLSPESHTVLTTAAVIGREFDIDLAIDAGAGTEDEILDAIDEAVRASVLEQSTNRDAERYAFTHELLGDVLRGSINPRRARKAHLRVAEAMERRSPERFAEIATHFDRAGEADRAWKYAMIAADAARMVYAHTEATDFLRVAERNSDTPAQLAEVRVQLEQIAESVGRYEEAEELCDLAIDWFSGQDDNRRALTLRRQRERLRGLLGQPARQTLQACLLLDEEAKTIGFDAERVSLLGMIAQAHWRLGERGAGEAAAWEGVHLAENDGDPVLLADALNRLGVALERDQPANAIDVYCRALQLYRNLGDARGQARCHNNLGIAYTLVGDWVEARSNLVTAIALGRTAGSPDLWGLAALNLGVVFMKGGDYERARDLFGEALALFATLKNSERQLYALYNLAWLDYERAEHEAASELFSVAASLAQRIGQSDVEIGALAGGGLALLKLARMEEARDAQQQAEERMRARTDWFQGRELMEALSIRMAHASGRLVDAVQHYEAARALAETGDLYAAAWLTAECAEVLGEHDPEFLRDSVTRYAERVRALGYVEMSRRYDELVARA